MPKADQIPTALPHTTNEPAPLPSVFDLGRHLSILWERLNFHDTRKIESKDGDEHHQAHADYEVTNEEIDAVEALIFTRPVKTLADGATLAIICFRVVDYLAAIEFESPRKEVSIARLRMAMARLSILLNEAGGLRDYAIGGSSFEYIARHASTGEVFLP